MTYPLKAPLKTLAAAALIGLGSAAAHAEITPDAIVSAYQADGYDRIEVKTGPTQIKVEAIKGNAKVEVIYDRATGETIKREVERVRMGEDTRPGVEVSSRSDDFIDDDDDDDDDRGRGRGRDDDDDDDDDDDRSGSGSGRDDDDDDDDDHGSDHD